MAKRNIVTKEDPSLYKHCREVTKFDPRLHTLLDDMKETLLDANGAGLAAPQVGVLRRAVIVLETNVAEDEDEYIIELINPEIVEVSGGQTGPEGCLSVPGEFGIVTRPMNVRVRAQDRYGKIFEVSGEGLTARAFCHEIDHLAGIIFTSLAERMLSEEELKNGMDDADGDDRL
jgi:peptide deformylase